METDEQVLIDFSIGMTADEGEVFVDGVSESHQIMPVHLEESTFL